MFFRIIFHPFWFSFTLPLTNYFSTESQKFLLYISYQHTSKTKYTSLILPAIIKNITKPILLCLLHSNKWQFTLMFGIKEQTYIIISGWTYGRLSRLLFLTLHIDSYVDHDTMFLWGVLVSLKFYWVPDIVEFVLSRFSHFNITIAYSNSKCCGVFVSSFEISAKRAHPW